MPNKKFFLLNFILLYFTFQEVGISHCIYNEGGDDNNNNNNEYCMYDVPALCAYPGVLNFFSIDFTFLTHF